MRNIYWRRRAKDLIVIFLKIIVTISSAENGWPDQENTRI